MITNTNMTDLDLEYRQKYQDFLSKISYDNLPQNQKEFIQNRAFKYHFSFSQVKQIFDIAVDLYIWNENSIDKIWKDNSNKNQKQSKKQAMEHILNN
jgi:hypothetical protein